MDLRAPWSVIGPVDVSGAQIPDGFHCPAYPDKPQRVFELPSSFDAIIAAALAYFPAGHKHRDALLSRMRPGQAHAMHVDQQGTDSYVTRVHVPLLTNPGCWMEFEEEGRRVHFAAGTAYTFDTNRRHAFGNEGTADRVHLIFDVTR